MGWRLVRRGSGGRAPCGRSRLSRLQQGRCTAHPPGLCLPPAQASVPGGPAPARPCTCTCAHPPPPTAAGLAPQKLQPDCPNSLARTPGQPPPRPASGSSYGLSSPGARCPSASPAPSTLPPPPGGLLPVTLAPMTLPGARAPGCTGFWGLPSSSHSGLHGGGDLPTVVAVLAAGCLVTRGPRPVVASVHTRDPWMLCRLGLLP